LSHAVCLSPLALSEQAKFESLLFFLFFFSCVPLFASYSISFYSLLEEKDIIKICTFYLDFLNYLLLVAVHKIKLEREKKKEITWQTIVNFQSINVVFS